MERFRRTFGQYQIIARIGRGGMAEIFLARVRGPGGFQKIVALKCVHPHLSDDEEFRAMFLDEAKLAAALDHPAIVQIHGLGEVDKTFFIAMEYVPGQPLHRIIRKLTAAGKRLPAKLAVRILAPIAEALAFAHDRRDLKGRPLSIVHRDVSPQNILVGYDGSAKLADFGIAKAEGRTHGTSGDAVKGKVAYMAPEQVLAETLDGRADVFALGIVLYELLTGVSPFRAPNEESMATMRRIVDFEPQMPSRLLPELGREVDAIVAKALAKQRDKRFSSARELAEALERWGHSLGPAPASELAALMHELFFEEIAALDAVLRGIDDPSGMGRLPLPTFGSRPDLPISVAPTLPDTRIARPARPTPAAIDLASLPAAAVPPGTDDTIGSHGAWVNYSHPRVERKRTWFWFPLGLAAALLGGGIVLMFSAPPAHPEGERREQDARADAPAHATPSTPAGGPHSTRRGVPRPAVSSAPVEPAVDPVPAPPGPVAGPRPWRPRTDVEPALPEEGAAAVPSTVGGTGRLTLDSDPWAQVYLEGRLIGETPIFEQRVAAGTVNVTLVNPDQNLRRTVRVEVPRDGVVRRRISLRDDGAP